MTEVIIDVREHDEYKIQHIKDSINVPLSIFSTLAPGVLNLLKDRKITFMCHSGFRATQASEQAKQLGYNDEREVSIFPGGIMKWIEKGRPVQMS
jgi:rhodanese-related sulfurtransferase